MFLKCQNINFAFSKEKKVLSDISFLLGKGDTLAIVGASGCGKSTLLRILSGILPNTKVNRFNGTISIDDLTPEQYRKTSKLAFMFQEATLMPNLTVKQNIELPLILSGNNNGQKINNLVKAVGLCEYRDYLPKHLSGGMKTRVALARSFTTNPELLLLDEPFSALDIAWKSKLYIELERLREEISSTIILVTHDIQEALLLADHVLVMSKTGGVDTQKEINTDYSKMQRMNDISGYMQSVYENYMLPIQEFILNGQN